MHELVAQLLGTVKTLYIYFAELIKRPRRTHRTNLFMGGAHKPLLLGAHCCVSRLHCSLAVFLCTSQSLLIASLHCIPIRPQGFCLFVSICEKLHMLAVQGNLLLFGVACPRVGSRKGKWIVKDSAANHNAVQPMLLGQFFTFNSVFNVAVTNYQSSGGQLIT